MKVGRGTTALISGAGSGIGKALALEMARRGASMTILDFNQETGLETLRLVQEEHRKLNVKHVAAVFVRCNVTDPGDVLAAFAEHKAAFGKLDVCINSAGIAEQGDFTVDDMWRLVLDVNLNGVIESTRLAIQLMRSEGGGAILNLASAGGLFPTHLYPVYAASKGGVVQFSRSLGYLQSEGIRVTALCPEYVDTSMTTIVPKEAIDELGGFISMDKVVQAALDLVEDETQAGVALWLSKRNGALRAITAIA